MLQNKSEVTTVKPVKRTSLPEYQRFLKAMEAVHEKRKQMHYVSNLNFGEKPEGEVLKSIQGQGYNSMN